MWRNFFVRVNHSQRSGPTSFTPTNLHTVFAANRMPTVPKRCRPFPPSPRALQKLAHVRRVLLSASAFCAVAGNWGHRSGPTQPPGASPIHETHFPQSGSTAGLTGLTGEHKS